MLQHRIDIVWWMASATPVPTETKPLNLIHTGSESHRLLVLTQVRHVDGTDVMNELASLALLDGGSSQAKHVVTKGV